MKSILRIRVAIALMVLLGASIASAREKDGVRMADTIQVDGQTLVLNGMGVREATVLNVNVYVAGLYVQSRTHDAREVLGDRGPKHLVLRFVRDVDRKDIVEAWNEGFRKNAGKSMGTLRQRVGTLNSWMANMKEGDTLSFTYKPKTGVDVAVRGTKRGTISGDDFAHVLFAIWLGADPPNKGLKEGLLGR